MEFGIHMLPDNAPFTEAAGFDDDETNKFMVVLTDGYQTEPVFGPGSARAGALGEATLEALCSNAKANGTTMMTLPVILMIPRPEIV